MSGTVFKFQIRKSEMSPHLIFSERWAKRPTFQCLLAMNIFQKINDKTVSWLLHRWARVNQVDAQVFKHNIRSVILCSTSEPAPRQEVRPCTGFGIYRWLDYHHDSRLGACWMSNSERRTYPLLYSSALLKRSGVAGNDQYCVKSYFLHLNLLLV